jgi:hypothetical protein
VLLQLIFRPEFLSVLLDVDEEDLSIGSGRFHLSGDPFRFYRDEFFLVEFDDFESDFVLGL